jgi:hypothetical protein
LTRRKRSRRLFAVTVLGSLVIHGTMPNLNDILDARAVSRQVGSKRISQYTRMKAAWDTKVTLLARPRFRKQLPPCHFVFVFNEPNMRRDPDGLSAGAYKFVLDGLQSAGAIAGDGWKQVLGLQSYWVTEKESGCQAGVVVLMSTEPMHLEDAMQRAKMLWRPLERQLSLGKRKPAEASLDRLLDRAIAKDKTGGAS